MLESNRAKLVKLEVEKGRLIDAYKAEVLSLDELANQKVDLDRQIDELTCAIKPWRMKYGPIP